MTAEADEQINGVVERVTFHSDETGFAVVRVAVRGHRDLVAVIGKAPSISPGEWVTAQGRWVEDPRHGRQFQAQDMRLTEPDTREGIQKYLGSGMIKGIGPVYAAKMVATFGREIFDVIERRSAELERIDGIGPQRRRRIKEAWEEQRTVRDIMSFLFSHGVSTARAFRIYKTYGEQAVAQVQADPYCLARDIRGIGFQTADRIAEHVGVARDSPLRARAGVAHVLRELTTEGHCAYPEEDLVDKATGILEIPSPIVRDAVSYEIDQRRLVRRPGPGGQLIYLAELDQAEEGLSRDLVALMGTPHPCPPIDLGKAIPWTESRMGIQLAPAQKEAVALAVQAKVLVLTGGPGVGKTTLVDAILRILKAKKLKTVLCAPTGRAAKRLAEASGQKARTIHRLLVFDPQHGGFNHNRDHPLGGDVFVVDESSMIDLPLANKLVQAIPRHAALILVGDVDQLPSVGPGSVLRDILTSGVVPVCRLDQVFRQAAASAIVSNAHRINQGQMPVFPEDKNTVADCYFVAAEEPALGVERIVDLVHRAVPRRFHLDPRTDIQVLSPMQRGELGARNLNVRLQAALNPHGDGIERFGAEFRSGDKVMQIQNNYDKDVYNGDIGRIASIDPDERELVVTFEGRRVPYDFQELDELVLAYATTIHKSQGSEYPCVIVPVHTQHYVMLQRNLLYTAVTRGRRLVLLVGTRKALGLCVNRADTRHRITTLCPRLQGQPLNY